MSKYEALTKFLSELDGDRIVMSFDSINDMIGVELPDSAFKHRPWWANRAEGKGSQNLAWQSVGWETKDVNMELDEVTFVRATKLQPQRHSGGSSGQLTIAQAKAGLAANFGVAESAIEINIRG